MEKGRITAAQLTAAAWAAVLAPAAGILPSLTARLAGQGGWLASLIALPAALVLVKVLGRLTAGRGLAGAIMEVLGRSAGRVLTFIYIMWALALAAARLRLSGQRLLFTAQRETGLWLFLIVLAAMALWLAWGKADAFVRAAAVFGRVLTLALGVVLGLSVFQMRPENLFPLWTQDVLPVIETALPTLGVLCYGAYAAFLWDGTGRDVGVKRRTAGGCGVLSLLVLAILGNMGAELTAALEDPFLTMSRQVGVQGAFQRVESLVSALWLLGDLALVGLLLWACRRMVEAIMPRWKGEWAALAGAAVSLLGAGVVFRDALLAQWFEYTLAPLGNLVLGAVTPAALYLLGKRKKG